MMKHGRFARPGRRRTRLGQNLVELLILLVIIGLAGIVAMSRLAGAVGHTGDQVAENIRTLQPLASGDSLQPVAVSSSSQALTQQSSGANLGPAQLVSSRRSGWNSPSIPPLPGEDGPGLPPPTAGLTIAAGAAAGCVVGGGAALAGIVTSIAAPVTCGVGALAGAGAAVVGIAIAPVVGPALGNVGSGIRNLFNRDDEGGGGEPSEADKVRRYVDGMEKKATPNSTARDLYEREVAGDTNYLVEGNGEQIWTDGVDQGEKAAIEAKYIDNPDESPFIENSNFYSNPKPWQQKLINEVDDEFRRYGQTLSDPNVPLKQLIVKVSDEDAIPFFDRLMTKYGIRGRIVVQEPKFWYSN
jgi:hypothetical protein